MRKPIFIAMVIMIMLTATFLPSNFVFADDTITAEVLNYNQNTLYHKFDDPSRIFYTTEGLYIATANGYEIFKDGNFEYSESRADDFTYLQGLITLRDGKIYQNNNPVNDESGYTAVSAYGSTLYALKGNYEIDKLTFAEGTFTSESYISDKNIRKIAASDSGCIYTTVNGYTNIIHIEDQEPIKITSEDIIDIDYKEKLYILTPTRIISYIDSSKSINYTVSGVISFSVGDGVYMLTRTGSINRISLDLAPDTHTAMIATESSEDWFYTDPTGGTTRLNKIYVVDKATDLKPGRIAVINGKEINYIDGFSLPIAVATDNNGVIYVAHYGNRITRIIGESRIDKDMSEDIVDIQVDYSNNLYCLTKSGKVINYEGTTIRENVVAFDYQGGWHYMTEDAIDGTPVDNVKDFAIDVMGSIFTVSGDDTLTAIIDGEQKKYTIQNASDIISITISKVDNDIVSYGDILLFDQTNKCVLIVDGKSVGSVNVKDIYEPPVLDNNPIERSEGLIGTVQGINETYMFSLPIEGEITRTLHSGDNVIICKDIPSHDPFVYCVCDDIQTDTLVGGYIYKDALKELPYKAPSHTEAKVNAPKTPIYKYPSINSPEIGQYDKNKMISILPFATTYGYEWYADDYPEPNKNKWYRIAYGDKEGFMLVSDTSVTFFSDDEMPKTNATIIQNATLYRFDEASNEYIRFEAIGGEIEKDQRVYVEPPFDTSREFTKIVFYKDNYGTVDAECYVKTQYIKYDGVDIIKIIAVAVIIVAAITLVLVIARRRKLARRPSARNEKIQ